MSYVARLAQNRNLMKNVLKGASNISRGHYDVNRQQTAERDFISATEEIKHGFKSIFDTTEETAVHISDLQNMLKNEKDPDMGALITEEIEEHQTQILTSEQEILEYATEHLIPYLESHAKYSKYDMYVDHCTMRIVPGIGGEEAEFFAYELWESYKRFFKNADWEYDVRYAVVEDSAETPSLKKTGAPNGHVKVRKAQKEVISVYEEEAFDYLQTESGFHRVQRVPENSKTIQTSTCLIEVEPVYGFQAQGSGLFDNDLGNVVEYMRKSDEFKITPYRAASGPGGQNVNTGTTGRRVQHRETGIIVEAASKALFETLSECAEKMQQQMLTRIAKEREEMLFKQVGRKKSTNITAFSRSDKIRTFNFSNRRITDHRLSRDYTIDDNVEDWLAMSNFMHFMKPLREEREYNELETQIGTMMSRFI